MDTRGDALIALGDCVTSFHSPRKVGIQPGTLFL